jgi:hypothetical protein
MAAFVVDAGADRQLPVAGGFSPADDARSRGRDALLAKLD